MHPIGIKKSPYHLLRRPRCEHSIAQRQQVEPVAEVPDGEHRIGVKQGVCAEPCEVERFTAARLQRMCLKFAASAMRMASAET